MSLHGCQFRGLIAHLLINLPSYPNRYGHFAQQIIDFGQANLYTYPLIMKKDTHPSNYRTVVFQDLNDNTSFLTRSTVTTDETIKWEDGNEYPLVKVHISSSSHPFYTGQEKLMDIEGRVDKFKARAEAAAKAKAARSAAATKKSGRKEASDEKKAAKIESQKPKEAVTADK